MNKKEMFVKDAVCCVILAVVVGGFLMFGDLERSSNLSVMEGITFIFFSALFTTVAVFVADLIRIYTMPDAIFTSGLSHTLKTKLFWKFGPQCIGWLIGFMLAGSFLETTFGMAGLVS